MITLRTDGAGEDYANKRLKSLLKVLTKKDLGKKIFKIHDHKGILNVYWDGVPRDEDVFLINKIWLDFGEPNIDHHICRSQPFKSFI